MKKIFLFVLVSFSALTWAQFVVPPAPKDGYVLDEAGILSDAEKQSFNQTIQAVEQATKHQIGIALVQSLQGRSIEEVGLAIARIWGIGHRGVDNGILILVAPNEREARIEVGRGLEGVLTDLRANRIIDEYMVPAFAEGQYYRGISQALDVIRPLIAGEIVELPEPPVDIYGIFSGLFIWLVWAGIFLGSVIFEPSKAWWPGMLLGVIIGGAVGGILVGTLFATIFGSILSGVVLGGMDWLFSTGKISAVRSRPHGGRWGGGGGFGGGGFGGGFGGGGFGGGGASGRW